MSGKTCPMLARSHWGLTTTHDRGAAHTLASTQSTVNLRSKRTGGWLVIAKGCHAGEDVRLPLGPVEIGSSWLADVVLTGPEIGSRHATLRIEGDDVEVTPLGPTRDVKVNGESAKTPTRLADGDLVSFGEVHAVFRLARAFDPGYAPVLRPRPAVIAPTRAQSYYTAGWLVASNGPLEGHDWRLVKGENRLGAGVGQEITLPGSYLPPWALTIACDQSGCRLSGWGPKLPPTVNGLAVTPGVLLRDSDRIVLGPQEFYAKCL